MPEMRVHHSSIVAFQVLQGPCQAFSGYRKMFHRGCLQLFMWSCWESQGMPKWQARRLQEAMCHIGSLRLLF